MGKGCGVDEFDFVMWDRWRVMVILGRGADGVVEALEGLEGLEGGWGLFGLSV